MCKNQKKLRHFIWTDNLKLFSVTENTILAKIIVDFWQVLAQVSFTTSETELDYYHQKANVQVVPQVAKRLKSRILGN